MKDDVWFKAFGKSNDIQSKRARTALKQLCLARDRLYQVWEAWTNTKPKPAIPEHDIEKAQALFVDQLQRCYHEVQEIEVFLSGYMERDKENGI